jgi:hypothetical protein
VSFSTLPGHSVLLKASQFHEDFPRLRAHF